MPTLSQENDRLRGEMDQLHNEIARLHLVRDQNDLLRRQNAALAARVAELTAGVPVDPGLRADLATALSLLSRALHACCGATDASGQEMVGSPGFEEVSEGYEQIKARFEALGGAAG